MSKKPILLLVLLVSIIFGTYNAIFFVRHSLNEQRMTIQLTFSN